MDGLPNGPWFAPDVEFPETGVDFLGLRAVNMRLIDACLPGISNVTHNVRCYSVASWMWWKARELMRAEDVDEARAAELRAFAERVETLFAWGHGVRGYTGAPGSRSSPPSAGVVALDFRSWGRSAANTSIMAAVRYGPSVKTTGGLGFLEPRKAGTFAVTEAGEALAVALDAELRPLAAYGAVLDRLAPVAGREADARALADAWRVGQATAGEVVAFREALRPPCGVGGRGARRTATIDLVRHTLARAPAPLDADALRRALATGRLSDGSTLALPSELAIVRERWLALQARQLQRLALEALLSWSEERMLRDRLRRLEDLRASLLASAAATSGVAAEAPFGVLLDAALLAFGEAGAPPEADLFAVWGTLAAALGARDGERMVGAALAALRCVQRVVAGLLERADARRRADGAGAAAEDEIVAACRLGGADRLSLSSLCAWLAARADAPAAAAAVDLVETHVLSRHMAVGVGRFDGERQRLRFTLEEEGLEPLIDAPLVPSVTEDRLEAALSLMAECGLVVRAGEDGYRAA